MDYLKRLRKDICEIFQAPTGIYYMPNEQNIRLGNALIIGPDDTPYEGGFYHFAMKIPNIYPMEPPKLRFLTSDPHRLVRFHPNLYPDELVCLSVINTWQGNSWTATQSITSLLIGIQSLLDRNSLREEPAIEPTAEAHQKYNICVAHENIRIATLYLLHHNPHSEFQRTMESYFCDHLDKYLKFCVNHFKYDGKIITAPFYTRFKVTCNFRGLYQSLLDEYRVLAPRYHTPEQISNNGIFSNHAEIQPTPKIRIRFRPKIFPT